MSKPAWSRQTPTYWVAEIDGCKVAVKKWWSGVVWPRGGWCYLVTFRPSAMMEWSCGYPSTLADAKAAAETMAQRWAKGEL